MYGSECGGLSLLDLFQQSTKPCLIIFIDPAIQIVDKDSAFSCNGNGYYFRRFNIRNINKPGQLINICKPFNYKFHIVWVCPKLQNSEPPNNSSLSGKNITSIAGNIISGRIRRAVAPPAFSSRKIKRKCSENLIPEGAVDFQKAQFQWIPDMK